MFHLFCRNGFPEQLVSDNAPHFVSYIFKEFTRKYAIKHKLSAPFHAATNGLAEKFVSTFKNALKKMKNDAGKLQCKISRFLLAYRNAPHSLTGESPGCLFMNRMLRTNIDCIQPRNDNIIAQKMENIRLKRGGRKRECLKVGQKVAVLNYSKYGGKWIRGTIKVIEGPLTYLV